MRRSFGLGVVAGVALLAGCATNPVTGERQFNLISEEQEIQLGQQAEPEVVKQFGGLYPDAQVQGVVQDVGMRLAKASDRPDLPWRFHVVNSPELNAFALPGGGIYITQGLLAQLTNEAQLAGVLGHEVAHVAARHQAQQISKSTALQAALGIGGAVAGDSTAGAIGATGAAIAANLLVLKYSRDMEHEADEVGIKYSAETGYDPRGMSELLSILLNAEQQGGKSGAGAPTFLLTHPATEDRIDDVREHIEEWYPPQELAKLTKDTPRFAQVIVPLTPQAPGAAAEPVPAGAPKAPAGR